MSHSVTQLTGPDTLEHHFYYLAKTHVLKTFSSLSLSLSPTLLLEDDDVHHSLKIQSQEQMKRKKIILLGHTKIGSF